MIGSCIMTTYIQRNHRLCGIIPWVLFDPHSFYLPKTQKPSQGCGAMTHNFKATLYGKKNGQYGEYLHVPSLAEFLAVTTCPKASWLWRAHGHKLNSIDNNKDNARGSFRNTTTARQTEKLVQRSMHINLPIVLSAAGTNVPETVASYLKTWQGQGTSTSYKMRRFVHRSSPFWLWR